MEKEVHLKVRKNLNGKQQLHIIKLKGKLISSGFTEIIHIFDHDEEFHINSFETPMATRTHVFKFIKAFITKENLEDTITLCE